MSIFQIKLLAITLMLLDHIGAYLLPEMAWLRIVGRLSFPLFAWLITNGFRHTSNVSRYLIRLFLFALISQVPFALVGGELAHPLEHLNIFFTLWIGLATITLYDRFDYWPIKLVCLGAGATLGWLLPVDYGAAGVLSIVAFHLSFNHLWVMFGSQLLIFSTFYSLPLLVDYVRHPELIIHPVRLWQPLAALSVGIIALYNGRKGPALRYVFYAFYPIHLLLIYFLQLLLYGQP